MLPKTLKPEHHAEVRAALKAYLDLQREQGDEIPLARVAAQLEYKGKGVAASSLSQWLADKYPSSGDRITRAVNLWLDRNTLRQQAQGERAFVDTWIAEQIAAIVSLADRQQKLAVVVSPAGSGKTLVMRALAAERNAFIVTCSDQMTPRQFLLALANVIGLDRARLPNMLLMQAIADRLRERSCLVFLDEAHLLRPACASVIRWLYDNTGKQPGDPGVPFIMFGAMSIFDMIDDRRGSGSGQMWSRTIKFNVANRAGVVEDPERPGQIGRKLFTVEEVRQVLAGRQIRLSRDVLALVRDIACLQEHGTLRLAVDVVRYATDLWPGEQVTRDLIFEALDLAQDAEADVIRAKVHHAEAQDQATPAVAAAG